MEKQYSGGEISLGRKLLVLICVLTLLSEVDGVVSRKELSEVHRRLKMLNKTPVKTIKSEDGEVIDCVDIYKQPAFDHPALKNHTIQMNPSSTNLANTTMEPTTKSATTIIPQAWHKHGTCPQGTIPIRRIQMADLLRAPSLDTYGRKNPSIPDTNANSTKFSRNNILSYLLTTGYSYIGAKAEINLWNPSLESDDEYSSGQIWLRNGPPQSYESVEAGWVVNPKVYGDRKTRFFAYWTADSSKTTGCYDLTCQGFIQTNHDVALGAYFTPTSQERSYQYQISISLHLDPITGNWWLQFGDKDLGYWPGELFSTLRRCASYVMFGGEVYSPNVRKTPHTTAHMGSGDWAEGLWSQACFIRQIRIMDYSRSWKFPEWTTKMADEYYCYNNRYHRDNIFSEPYFYFGGPGQNMQCP
ncbi:hypothetical protein ACHQM5_001948 [Ranunculus cassubicifolius]